MNIRRRLTLTVRNILFHSESFPSLIGLFALIIGVFTIPKVQHDYELLRYDLKTRKDALVSFAQSVTEQVNYYSTSNEFNCKSENSIDDNDKKYFFDKSQEFYSKVVSSSTPYETACTVLQVYFDGATEREMINEFRNMLDAHFSGVYLFDEDPAKNSCKESTLFKDQENKIYTSYNKLIIHLNELLKEYR